MENLWEMIAKNRGVKLDEEFLYSLDGAEYKYRINGKGLEIYYDVHWYSSSRSNAFIRGGGKIERLPLAPKMGENYCTYNSQEIDIETCCWSNSSFDKERKLLGIIFRTKQEAKDYLPTWLKRLDSEEC